MSLVLVMKLGKFQKYLHTFTQTLPQPKLSILLQADVLNVILELM